MKEPVELADSLGFHFSEMQADVIASEVYQPLLEKIEDLQNQINNLQNRGE